MTTALIIATMAPAILWTWRAMLTLATHIYETLPPATLEEPNNPPAWEPSAECEVHAYYW